MKFQLVLGALALFVVCHAKIEPRFAPYIDVTEATKKNDFNLVDLKNKYGLKAVTLAFALGGSAGCSPMWGGEQEITEPKIIDVVKAFKAAGGDVIVATGGAAGPYLETACGSAADLANAYKKVLSTVNSTHLDIDIEAAVSTDTMNQALATLQKSNPSTTVSFTLRVQGDDYGLTDATGVDVLQSAAKHGVNVDIVNPMTMEFGSSKASWGEACIAAAEATHTQMKKVWPNKSDAELYSMLGVTPMLGKNYNGKVFDQTAAKQLLAWAKDKKIGHLAFWSLGRDKACPGSGISPDCSSISEADHEFTKIFAAFN